MLVLILAGGTGTRLWPGSRKSTPKQLLSLSGEDSMMQRTVKRVLPIVPAEHIFIATNAEYRPLMRAQLPDVPLENIIAEPSAKHTAPCIGLAAKHMQQLDPDEVMASLHADHAIADEEGFRQALLAAEELAREGYLVTLGIEPTRPETGYGYVQRGESLGSYNGYEGYDVAQFLEKPNLETAQRFVDSGEYYWNSGIFIWQLSTLMDNFQQFLPDLASRLAIIGDAIATGEPIEPLWEQITPTSIDVGIMEQAKQVAVVPVNIGWNDVGSWAAIHEVNEADEQGNVVLGAEHIGIETTGTLIQADGRLVATIGLEDVVIVDTGDALLVCAKDKAQDVRKIVDWLKAQGRDELL